MSTHFQCHHAVVAYRTETEPVYALRDVSLSINQGEWIAFVGRNGSGKSTLGRALAGLTRLSKGQITNAIGGSVGIVFQNPDAQIVGQTVYEDVCFGLENHAVPTAEMRERVEWALGEVGLLHKLHSDVDTLSGGQKQLLCIASVLALQPSAIVFDEATSMLSPMARKTVLDVIRRIHQAGTTILWITQWMDELSYADGVIALQNGFVHYDGNVASFFYSNHGDVPSPCEKMGFLPPFTVQVAQRMQQAGKSWAKLPLIPSDLVKEVFRV